MSIAKAAICWPAVRSPVRSSGVGQVRHVGAGHALCHRCQAMRRPRLAVVLLVLVKEVALELVAGCNSDRGASPAGPSSLRLAVPHQLLPLLEEEQSVCLFGLDSTWQPVGYALAPVEMAHVGEVECVLLPCEILIVEFRASEELLELSWVSQLCCEGSEAVVLARSASLLAASAALCASPLARQSARLGWTQRDRAPTAFTWHKLIHF